MLILTKPRKAELQSLLFGISAFKESLHGIPQIQSLYKPFLLDVNVQYELAASRLSFELLKWTGLPSVSI